MHCKLLAETLTKPANLLSKSTDHVIVTHYAHHIHAHALLKLTILHSVSDKAFLYPACTKSPCDLKWDARDSTSEQNVSFSRHGLICTAEAVPVNKTTHK